MFILTIYIAAREMFQFTFSPCTYLKGLENYLECTLVVLVMLILFDVCPISYRRTFGSLSILFIAIEIFLLAGSLPFWSFSTHYVMLRTVTYSFLKSLSLYAIILLAFALSFFTLLHEPTEEETDGSKSGDDNGDEDDGDFNKFSNLGLSIMKTLVMSTGEFDVASIDFKANAFSYVVFMMFLFLVTIILLNLLNGLAVSDTQAIKSEAELTNFIRRAQVLARYECVLATSYSTVFKILPFCHEFDTFDETKPIYNIRIKPNDNNQILIPDTNNTNDEVNQTDDNLRPLLCFHRLCCNRCTHMDSKIVKLAFQCLEKTAIEQHEENEREKHNERLTRMEETLETIVDKLNDILNK
ncbi:transient receptor potential cation channel protein painless-like [Contarinia nasturtii]|uniref:transient receptor potential cation channel protein painless-like n=1 Tax=Contarinia nasturtii TaxID=265458 RepID=UPI0012D39E80|nr:transient receptor potential cation channel protein painless-like [Contarinia nasturtii]